MTAYDFIFSGKSRHRHLRHITLWMFFCLYFFIVNFLPTSAADVSNIQTYAIAFKKLVYIPVSVLSAYITAYFLLPKFLLRGKYFAFAISFIALCVLNFFNAFYITKIYVWLTLKTSFNQLPIHVTVFQPIIYGLGLGSTTGVFAGVARLLKIHYLEQKENERLEKLKIITELEIIKTHFHPHFLSEALRNISRLIRNRSPEAPAAILKLADLLSYFLYEHEKESVSLEQEMQIMHTYLELEKIFYGDRIQIEVKEFCKKNDIEIAPLIIVSIVQHCCEQSLLSLQQVLVIDIDVRTQGNQLEFQLRCNGYHENISGALQQSEGLAQVMRRVKVLYPDKHQLKTEFENGIFFFMLSLAGENVFKTIDNKTTMKLSYEHA